MEGSAGVYWRFFGTPVAVFTAIQFLKNNLMRLSAPYREYKTVIDGIFGASVRKNVSKYYIPTRCQDKDPCNEEEIYEFNGKYVTEKLIPFFCNKAFASESFGKYYMILADSGMGKTTFLVRLYRDYVLKIKLLPRKKMGICFVSLTEKDWISRIRNVTVPGNTILLMDALDENSEAIADCDLFLKRILDETKKFNKIVITCRTQFFSNQKSEPKRTGLVHAGTGKKSSEFIKKYVTPFTEHEVDLYLKKRFKFNYFLQKDAKKIIRKVPEVMARPLILNWIDYLLDKKKPLNYSFEIYGRIMSEWVERECGGQWIEKDSGKLTKGKLVRLSYEIAQYMLDNEVTLVPAEIVDEMARKENIEIEPILAKSRSLLNRNSNGEFKFAHRSFLEFILAKKVYEKKEIPTNDYFLHSMSGFRRFFCEYIKRDLCATYGVEELNHYFAEPEIFSMTTLEGAFGPDVLKLYSVKNHKWSDNSCALLVKIAFFSKDIYRILPGIECNYLLFEIVLGKQKKHYAQIARSSVMIANNTFTDTHITPFLDDVSDIRQVGWDCLPHGSTLIEFMK